MRYLFPKTPRVGYQRVALQERTTEGCSCFMVSKYFQGLFLQVLLPLIRSWTRRKWMGTFCQFLVGSHLFSSEASHENLAPFDFIPWKLWLNSQASNVTYFSSFKKIVDGEPFLLKVLLFTLFKMSETEDLVKDLVVHVQVGRLKLQSHRQS